MLSSFFELELSPRRVPFACTEEPRILFQQQNPVVMDDETQGRVSSQLDNSGAAFLLKQDDRLGQVTV